MVFQYIYIYIYCYCFHSSSVVRLSLYYRIISRRTLIRGLSNFDPGHRPSFLSEIINIYQRYIARSHSMWILLLDLTPRRREFKKNLLDLEDSSRQKAEPCFVRELITFRDQHGSTGREGRIFIRSHVGRGREREGRNYHGERERKRNYRRSMTEFPAVFSVRPAAFTAR